MRYLSSNGSNRAGEQPDENRLPSLPVPDSPPDSASRGRLCPDLPRVASSATAGLFEEGGGGDPPDPRASTSSNACCLARSESQALRSRARSLRAQQSLLPPDNGKKAQQKRVDDIERVVVSGDHLQR